VSQDVPKKGEPILFTDVESLPATEDNELWRQLAPKIGLPEGVFSETEEERAARIIKLRENSALFAPLGRAWMIGFADRNEEPTILQSDGSPEGEKPLLEEFWEKIKDYDNPWWVGHNITGYDIPFIKVRALHHGLTGLARMFGGPYRQKPWEVRVWPRTGADKWAFRDHGLYGLGKLDTICHLLGVERQDGVMGPDVYQAYLEGNHRGVAEHLDYDIRQVREVFKKLWAII
jgi:hypothetical protein